MKQNGWLTAKHPVYEAWREDWAAGERRLRGGRDVLRELRRFEWELPGGEHYAARQAQATYINFPEMLVTAMVGHLLRSRPQPGQALSFGALGDVRRERDPSSPTRAEMVYYNVDGRGTDGSQWYAWWARVERNAMATGHRWLFCDAPQRPPLPEGKLPSLEDELRGYRPYLVEHSPLSVPMWHYEEGTLQMAIIRVPHGRIKIENGSFVSGQRRRGFLLLVRAGFRGLDGAGEQYARGGWWLFDPDGVELQNASWEPALGGAIPMWPHFYEPDSTSDTEDDVDAGRPTMSRPGTWELGQVAVSYMNLSSAADYDAWDAASSLLFLLGVDPAGYKVATEALLGGSKIVPVPTPAANGGMGESQRPDIKDGSMGAVVSEVFNARLEAKRREAADMAAREATSTPDSSGRAREAGFNEVKAPRLAAMAEQMETSTNTGLAFLERRWGITAPRASNSWPREFDLAPLATKIEKIFNLQLLTGLASPTLSSRLMTETVRAEGLVTDDDVLDTVEAEYTVAAFQKATADAQASAFGAEAAAAHTSGAQDLDPIEGEAE